MTNDKNGKEVVQKQKENRTGWAGEGKQGKGNIGEEKMPVVFAKFELCDEIG